MAPANTRRRSMFIEKEKNLVKRNNKPGFKETTTRKNVRRKVDEDSCTGVIKLNHIPHGFYETQMQEYFSQFGKVLRVKVGRSAKTGRNLDYAFVEFANSFVARTAAEAMDNYLMFGKLMKCKYIPFEERRPFMFVDQFELFKQKIRKAEEKPMKTEKVMRRKLKKSVNKVERKLKSLGINFNFAFENSVNLNKPRLQSNEKISIQPNSNKSLVDGEILSTLPVMKNFK